MWRSIENGHVYTGDSEARTVNDIDPVGMKVVSSVSVPGLIDATLYDAKFHHIYADEDDARGSSSTRAP